MNFSSPSDSKPFSQSAVPQNGYVFLSDSIPDWESLTLEQQQVIVNLYEQQEALTNGYACPGYESFSYGFPSVAPESVQVYLPPPRFLDQFAIPQPQFHPPIQQETQTEQIQQPTQREAQAETQQPTYELNDGDRPYADTPSAVQTWYYTGRVSDQLQIAYGRVPPDEITPWGLAQFAELKAMAMTNRVEKLVEGRKASLGSRGIQIAEADEQSLYREAVVNVWEQVKAVDRERLENWQQGKDHTLCSDFFGESTQKAQKVQDQPEAPSLTGARAKLEEARQQHGRTDPDRKVERAIER